MTTPNGTVGDQVEGLVEAVNDRGIKVQGEWRNQSKFHPVDLPDRGARVRLELDTKGFIPTLQVLDAAPSSTSSTSSPSRDRTITRLSVLKTAAAFLAQMGQVHEGVKSDHVIPLAERWPVRTAPSWRRTDAVPLSPQAHAARRPRSLLHDGRRGLGTAPAGAPGQSGSRPWPRVPRSLAAHSRRPVYERSTDARDTADAGRARIGMPAGARAGARDIAQRRGRVATAEHGLPRGR